MTATNMCSNFGGLWYSPPKKSIFLIKMSHIQLDSAILIFLSIFEENDRKTSLLGQKSVFLNKMSHMQLN